MEQKELKRILKKLSDGEISGEEAYLRIREEPFTDLGFAKIDRHRQIRQGAAEVIYGAGKSAGQIAKIAETMLEAGTKTILITRMSMDKTSEVKEKLYSSKGVLGTDRYLFTDDIFPDGAVPFFYDRDAQAAVIGRFPEPDGNGTIVIAAAGTSDLYAAQEAVLTAKALGNEVITLYDVGVSGLHRLLAHLDELMSASVVVAVAGMEGAMASVIGGLVDCPVIAVPTSVGYGANFHGLSALLSMLNSCASGVSVVNIDNGFGAGYQASMINHPKDKGADASSGTDRSAGNQKTE